MLIILFSISDTERDIISELIIAVSRGDESALASVYQRVGGRLLSIAIGLTRDRSSAQDVLHDSFIKIAKYAYQFKRGTNGYAWLCKIVRNTAINKIKSENLRRGFDIDGFFNLADGGDMAEKSDTAVLVENALKALSSRERTVIWLKYYNDMTVREIAAELSIPKSTAHEAIKAAEEKLRKELGAPDKNR